MKYTRNVIFVLAPLGAATWILATHTVGASLVPGNDVTIGFAVALLVVVTAGYLLFAGGAASRQGPILGALLIGCGSACILTSVALQFKLASMAGDNARLLADILTEGVRVGRPVNNVNINSNLHPSVPGVSYLALLAGVWMAAVGISVGTRRAVQPAHPDVSRPIAERVPEPVAAAETGVRARDT
jgi:hypothetical protein